MEDGVEFPISPKDAFGSHEKKERDSQITLFLLLGALFGTGRERVQRDAQATREQFPIPEVRERIYGDDPRPRLEAFRERYRLSPSRLLSESEYEYDDDSARRGEIGAELVERIYARGGDAESVVDLILLGLGDRDEFIRIASAISYLDIFSEIGLAIRSLLADATDYNEELAGLMAEAALRRFGRAGAESLVKQPHAPPSSRAQSTAIIVHGSHFAFVGQKMSEWWKPSEPFHSYIKGHHHPRLYHKPDFYTWSGGWSDHARKLAARELRDWARNRNLQPVDVLAHSHGGNVAMWATQLGMEIDRLVLLSCPEHMQHYQPEFSRVRKVISYQIKLDWVILADGGGTFFNHDKIDDRVLNKWFRRHSDTHDPAFWKKHGLTI